MESRLFWILAFGVLYKAQVASSTLNQAIGQTLTYGCEVACQKATGEIDECVACCESLCGRVSGDGSSAFGYYVGYGCYKPRATKTGTLVAVGDNCDNIRNEACPTMADATTYMKPDPYFANGTRLESIGNNEYNLKYDESVNLVSPLYRYDCKYPRNPDTTPGYYIFVWKFNHLGGGPPATMKNRIRLNFRDFNTHTKNDPCNTNSKKHDHVEFRNIGNGVTVDYCGGNTGETIQSQVGAQLVIIFRISADDDTRRGFDIAIEAW